MACFCQCFSIVDHSSLSVICLFAFVKKIQIRGGKIINKQGVHLRVAIVLLAKFILVSIFGDVLFLDTKNSTYFFFIFNSTKLHHFLISGGTQLTVVAYDINRWIWSIQLIWALLVECESLNEAIFFHKMYKVLVHFKNLKCDLQVFAIAIVHSQYFRTYPNRKVLFICEELTTF